MIDARVVFSPPFVSTAGGFKRAREVGGNSYPLNYKPLGAAARTLTQIPTPPTILAGVHALWIAFLNASLMTMKPSFDPPAQPIRFAHPSHASRSRVPPLGDSSVFVKQLVIGRSESAERSND